MGDKKEEALKWLKDFKKLPTSRFVGLLGLDYDTVKKILEELELENKIIKIEETVATYWKLKEGIKNGKETKN